MNRLMSPHVVGYLSSLILIITLGSQIHKQWKRGSSRGVSPWLFIGQFIASCGFTAYSVLIYNQLFVITNSCLAVAALIGLAIVVYHRSKMRHSSVRDVLGRSDRIGAPGSGRADWQGARDRMERHTTPLEVHQHGQTLHRT